MPCRKVAFDLVGAIADHDHRPRDTCLRQRGELLVEDCAVRHRDDGFRHVLRERQQARAAPGTEDDGLHESGHDRCRQVPIERCPVMLPGEGAHRPVAVHRDSSVGER